jgi:hypothetical protein
MSDSKYFIENLIKFDVKQQHCQHGMSFDEDDAKTLSAEEIKKKYPRFHGFCSTCGFNGIAYVSWAHYILGDW